MDIENIKNKVLKDIKPTKEERKKVKEFVRNLKTTAEVKSGKDAVIVGSTGKKNWISGDHDIDLFLLFPKTYSKQKLEDNGLKYGKQIAKEFDAEWDINFAEHPYVKAKISGYNVDIVPCFRIKKGDKIKSSVDRSPLHLNFVLDKLDAGLRNEVRLLKQFMKSIEVYGSDAKTKGFSGYLCELLVIKYGKFQDVLRNVKDWKPTTVVDPQNYIKKEKNTIKKFPSKSLIILDPTDRERNAAAVVSADKYIRFIQKSREFLKNPSIDYFKIRKKEKLTEKEIKELKNRETKFLALKIKKPDIIEDNLFPQLRKLNKRINQLLKNHEFKTMRKYVFDSQTYAYLVLEMEIWHLPKIEKMVGPLITSKKHTKEFLEKYKDPMFGPYIENKKWVAERKRKFQNAHKLIIDFISKEKKELKNSGVPKGLVDVAYKSQVLEHENFWKEVKKEDKLSKGLKIKYFESMKI